jgi:hypothetical protein
MTRHGKVTPRALLVASLLSTASWLVLWLVGLLLAGWLNG